MLWNILARPHISPLPFPKITSKINDLRTHTFNIDACFDDDDDARRVVFNASREVTRKYDSPLWKVVFPEQFLEETIDCAKKLFFRSF